MEDAGTYIRGLGDKLVEFRACRGISRRIFSLLTGISEPTLAKLERRIPISNNSLLQIDIIIERAEILDLIVVTDHRRCYHCISYRDFNKDHSPRIFEKVPFKGDIEALGKKIGLRGFFDMEQEEIQWLS